MTAVEEPPTSGPGSDPSRLIASQVGAAVRKRRLQQGLTMSALARSSGVSGPFISLLERGLTSISIVTLFRVAGSLDTTPDRLLQGLAAEDTESDSPTEPIRVVPAAIAQRGVLAERPPTLVRRELGAPHPQSRMTVVQHLVDPGSAGGDGTKESPDHDTEDFLYVVRGRLELRFHDGRRLQLAAGESMHVPAGARRRCLVVGSEETEILQMSVQPRPTGLGATTTR